MVPIFTETTSLLAPEFVSSFPAEKLAFTLFRISKDFGVEFNQVRKTFTVVGDWNKVIQAHTYLEKYLEKENLELGLDFDKQDANISVNSGMITESKRGRKPGCTVARPQQDSVPEPYVQFINSSNTTVEIKLDCQNVSDRIIENSHDNRNADATSMSTNQVASNTTDSNTPQNDCFKENSETIITVKEEFDETVLDDDTDIDEQYVNQDEAEAESFKDSFNQSIKVKVEDSQGDQTSKGTKSRRKSKPKKYSKSDNTEGVTLDSSAQKKSKEKKKGRHSILKEQKEKLIQKTTNDKEALSEEKEKEIEEPRNSSKKSKPVINFQCDKCEYIGKRKENLREHMKRMHRNKFSCDLCSKKFGLHKDLMRHQRHVHTNPAFHCKICNKTYKFSRAYNEHMQSHQENYVKPQFDCEICDKSFSTKYVLTAHVKSEHLGMKKSFVCPTCGRSFTQKNSYLMHANVHAGIKPYVCDVCGKAFSYDKSLREHKYMHDDERRFSCHVCAKAFRQKTSLVMHMKVHKEERDYICSTCGKGFTQKQALLRHERIHSGDKPFKCALCLRAFNDYSIIRRHMMMHHKRDKDPKTWRGDIICTLKRKTEFYISGGPGYNGGERIPTQVEGEELSDQQFQDDTSAMNKSHDDLGQNVEGVRTSEESVMRYSDNTSAVGNSEARSPYQSVIHSEGAKVSEEVSSVSPLNYSMPGACPQAVPVTSSDSHDISRQYQEMLDYHQGQRREIFMQNLSSIAPLPVLPPPHGPHLPTGSGDGGQPQSLPSHWSLPGYPYSTNFSQFQGPQS